MRQLDRDARILLGTDPATSEEKAAAAARSGTTLVALDGMVGPADIERWKAPALAAPGAAVEAGVAPASKRVARIEQFRGMTKAQRDELFDELMRAEYPDLDEPEAA